MNTYSERLRWPTLRPGGGLPAARSRRFFFDNQNEPSIFEQTAPQVFPATALWSFTYLPDCGKIEMISFYPFQRTLITMASLCAVESALDYGDGTAMERAPDTGNDHVLLLCRRCQDERLAAVFNFSEQPQRIALPSGEYAELLANRTVRGGEAEIYGYGFLWLKGRNE